MRKYIMMIAAMAVGVLFISSCSKDETGKTDEELMKEGLSYLDENGKREGVVTTTSGLQYEVLREGDSDGKSPMATDIVKCHYEGSLIDGTVFDSSYKRGEPIEFSLLRVIKGWTEGLQYMKEGAKYRFYIPFFLGYGASGYSTIPPYATLIFDVELIEVVD